MAQGLVSNYSSNLAFAKNTQLYLYTRVSGTDSVVKLHDIVEKIQSYYMIVYTDQECDNIHRLLADADIIDKQMRKSHIKEIRKQ